MNLWLEERNEWGVEEEGKTWGSALGRIGGGWGNAGSSLVVVVSYCRQSLRNYHVGLPQ